VTEAEDDESVSASADATDAAEDDEQAATTSDAAEDDEQAEGIEE
jgi:hypothetical protein